MTNRASYDKPEDAIARFKGRVSSDILDALWLVFRCMACEYPDGSRTGKGWRYYEHTHTPEQLELLHEFEHAHQWRRPRKFSDLAELAEWKRTTKRREDGLA